MARPLERFEFITRRAHRFTDAEDRMEQPLHPFESRNIDDSLPDVVRRLFDNAHYSQATFEAFKYLEKVVQVDSGLSASGVKLMMQAFGGSPPPVCMNALASTSEKDEQDGYKFLFAGGTQAIRNPRGHEYDLDDDLELCLDHLSFVSMLVRRLAEANS